MGGEVQTRLIRINPRRLKLLEVNARYMRHETFQALVRNVQRDGSLTSVPFAAAYKFTGFDVAPERDASGDIVWEVLSGNHRVMAAIEAGLDEIDLMVTDEPIEKPRRIAIQLSHNALVGEDDPSTLKQLYQAISDVDMKLYAGLDDKTLELLEKVQIGSLSEANLDFQTIAITFLPHEMERVRDAFDVARKAVGADEFWLARWGEYDALLDGLESAAGAHGVKNTATALLIILSVFERHLTDLASAWCDADGEAKDNRRVPLESILGTRTMPGQAAAVLKRAIDGMVSRGDVDEMARWRALEFMAVEYMNGPDCSSEVA